MLVATSTAVPGSLTVSVLHSGSGTDRALAVHLIPCPVVRMMQALTPVADGVRGSDCFRPFRRASLSLSPVANSFGDGRVSLARRTLPFALRHFQLFHLVPENTQCVNVVCDLMFQTGIPPLVMKRRRMEGGGLWAISRGVRVRVSLLGMKPKRSTTINKLGRHWGGPLYVSQRVEPDTHADFT